MKVELPDDIKQKTTKCEHDFECLATGRCGSRKMCRVVGFFGPHVLQLATHRPVSCAYRVSFGDGQLCTCPVHCYLHFVGHGYALEKLRSV